MHPDTTNHQDGLRTQVGPDPLDYVLRCAACDYDCYHQGRYIGSRPTLTRAVEAIAYEQAKARRHPLPVAQAVTLPLCRQELAALITQVQELGEQLAGQPSRRAHLTLVQLQLSAAQRSLEAAERSLALVQRMEAVHIAIDPAA